MSDEIKIKEAQKVFETLCTALNNRGWRFQRDDSQFTVRYGVNGDDLPMEFVFKVDAERGVLLLFSVLSMNIKKEKAVEMAVAVSIINNVIVDGCFDFDIKNGRMHFRMTNSYIESIIGEELIEYMIDCSCSTVDDFNEKLMGLSSGLITLEQFVQSIGK